MASIYHGQEIHYIYSWQHGSTNRLCSNVVQVERSRVHTTKALTRSSNLFLIFGFYDFTFVHNTSSTAISQISNASHMFLLLALFISFIF